MEHQCKKTISMELVDFLFIKHAVLLDSPKLNNKQREYKNTEQKSDKWPGWS